MWNSSGHPRCNQSATSLRSILSHFYSSLCFTDGRDTSQPSTVSDLECSSRLTENGSTFIRAQSCSGPPIQRRNERSVRRCVVPLARYLIDVLSVLDFSERRQLIREMFPRQKEEDAQNHEGIRFDLTTTSNDESGKLVERTKSSTEDLIAFLARGRDLASYGIHFGVPAYGAFPVESSPGFHTAAPNVIEVLEIVEGLKHLDRYTGASLNPNEFEVLHIMGVSNVSELDDFKTEMTESVEKEKGEELQVQEEFSPSSTGSVRRSLSAVFPVKVPVVELTRQEQPFLYAFDLHVWPSCIPIGIRVKLSILPSLTDQELLEGATPQPQLIAESFGCADPEVFWLPEEPSTNVWIYNEPDELQVSLYNKDRQTAKPYHSTPSTSPVPRSSKVSSWQNDGVDPNEILRLADCAISDRKRGSVDETAAVGDLGVYLAGSGIPLTDDLPMRNVILVYEATLVEESENMKEYGDWADEESECWSGKDA